MFSKDNDAEMQSLTGIEWPGEDEKSSISLSLRKFKDSDTGLAEQEHNTVFMAEAHTISMFLSHSWTSANTPQQFHITKEPAIFSPLQPSPLYLLPKTSLILLLYHAIFFWISLRQHVLQTLESINMHVWFIAYKAIKWILPGDDDVGRDGNREDVDRWNLPSTNLDVLIDVALVVVVDVVAVDAGAVAVGAASWRDAPMRREDRQEVILIPAAANPTALGGSEVVVQRYHNASRQWPTKIRLCHYSFLLTKRLANKIYFAW